MRKCETTALWRRLKKKPDHCCEASAYLDPFAVDAVWRDGGVGVPAGQLDAVALCDALHLIVDVLNGLQLLLGIAQGGFELLVGCNQTLRRRGRTKERQIWAFWYKCTHNHFISSIILQSSSC